MAKIEEDPVVEVVELKKPVKNSRAILQDRGGYDCEFVTPPPDTFQTECPICLQILKQPCVISCPCGQKICLECVERIKKDNKPCPLCNKTDFTFIRDYGLERSLKELMVYCSMKKEGCEWQGKLADLENHLQIASDTESSATNPGCLFYKVKCPLYYAGCDAILARRDLAKHITEETASHVTLLAATTQSLMIKNKEMQSKLPTTEENLKTELSQNSDMAYRLKEMEEKMNNLQREVQITRQRIGLFPIDYHTNSTAFSQFSFYTSTKGYQVCMKIHPTGEGPAKGSHVSIYLYLMRGEHNDSLKWPFRAIIKIQIVNQIEDKNHFEDTITFGMRTPTKSTIRVIGRDMSPSGWGKPNFIPLSRLPHDQTKNTQYLKDNVIIIRIVSAEVI